MHAPIQRRRIAVVFAEEERKRAAATLPGVGPGIPDRGSDVRSNLDCPAGWLGDGAQPDRFAVRIAVIGQHVDENWLVGGDDRRIIDRHRSRVAASGHRRHRHHHQRRRQSSIAIHDGVSEGVDPVECKVGHILQLPAALRDGPVLWLSKPGDRERFTVGVAVMGQDVNQNRLVQERDLGSGVLA